ncbi:hypothetical protein HYX10_06065 [Candidatus Woesearchaeota archaeon]|nr:hypothetical protein [Candidatus Woesearchaeota archaeon]
MVKDVSEYGFVIVALAATLVTAFVVHGILASAQGDDVGVLEGAEEILVEERAGITPDSPLYVFDKIVDNVQLASSRGEDKARKALEIKEERLAEASVMVDGSKSGKAGEALLLAAGAAKIAQAEIAPDLENEANENVRRAARLLTDIKDKLPGEGWEDVEASLNAQLDEEEKTRIAVIVAKSRLSYCDALAKQDFALLKSDERCDIGKSPEWLRSKVEGPMSEREENARRLIFDVVSSCVVDPKQCDCSKIPVGKHAASCEVNRALAIRCEYEADNDACRQLDGAEDEFLDILDEGRKSSIRELLREKEEEFFDRFKPPECAEAETFEECFDIMKGIYGLPPFCEGLSDAECQEKIRTMGPEEMEAQMPPECRDAGVASPKECGRLMMDKYGKPPECADLDVDECIDLMMKNGPQHVGGRGMPPECVAAGVASPRECFDIMTAKFGVPPFCEGLSDDECFEEAMKHGPSQGPGPEGPGAEGFSPPQCREAGVSGKECAARMLELFGKPPECDELSTEECIEKVMRAPPDVSRACIGLSPQECRDKIQSEFGAPGCEGLGHEDCIDEQQRRGVPGGLPVECAGLGHDECQRIMMERFGPPECKGLSREQCEDVMAEKRGNDIRGFDVDCEGISRSECESRMFSRFAPPECEGLPPDECRRIMSESRGPSGEPGRGGFIPHDEEIRGGMPGVPECEGLSKEECMELMRDRFAPVGGMPDEQHGAGRDFNGGVPPGRVPGDIRIPEGAPGEFRDYPQRVPEDFRDPGSFVPEGREQPEEFHDSSGEFAEEPDSHGGEFGDAEKALEDITGGLIAVIEWLKK